MNATNDTNLFKKNFKTQIMCKTLSGRKENCIQQKISIHQ